MIKKLGFIFTAREKRMLVFLMFIIVVGSFLELLGVTAFMPFIDILMDEMRLRIAGGFPGCILYSILIQGKPSLPPLQDVLLPSIFSKMYLLPGKKIRFTGFLIISREEYLPDCSKHI